MLGCTLLLMVLAAFRPSVTPQAEQDQEKRATGPRWEYKVVNLGTQCGSDPGLDATLNMMGQQGWELVNIERLTPSFPHDAEGTLLIRPAATGPGKLNNPQTADSFQGTMAIKMYPIPQPLCHAVFKRQWSAKAKP
jgi:hypothetical protein